MDGLPGFVMAALALAGSPGPSNLSLAAAGAAFGTRASLGYMIGIVIGMVGVMAITASGVVSMVLAVPGAAPAVASVAAAYFVYLALRIATAPPLTDSSRPRHEPSFAGGILLSLVNPKGYAAMAALFSSFVLVRSSLALDVAVKIAVLAALITGLNVVWLASGAALTRFFREPRSNRAINVTFAIALIASLAVAMLF